jgi:hypothetical protein
MAGMCRLETFNFTQKSVHILCEVKIQQFQISTITQKDLLLDL